mmetsp:Transcript_32380/g.36722  ORF Transcript_32380/g.36722 Transcript_32380/m.36722 type:complete len:601 (-) Transcript_32380:108-1910(-)
MSSLSDYFNESTKDLVDQHLIPETSETTTIDEPIRFLSGSLYHGQVRNRKRHGYGVMKFHSGHYYEGNWREDRPTFGRFNYRNGQSVEGYFNEQAFTNYARYQVPGNFKYEGEMVNTDDDIDFHASGKGYVCYERGDEFWGSLELGWKRLRGLHKWTSENTTYEGVFQDNLPDGRGVTVYPSGSKYVGDHKANGRHGFGVFTWADGRKFEGNWVENEYDVGIYTYANGDVYEGMFQGAVKQGKAKYTWSNGDTYEGEYVENVKSGVGVLTFSDGRVQRGIFKDDAYVGLVPGEEGKNIPSESLKSESETQDKASGQETASEENSKKKEEKTPTKVERHRRLSKEDIEQRVNYEQAKVKEFARSYWDNTVDEIMRNKGSEIEAKRKKSLEDQQDADKLKKRNNSGIETREVTEEEKVLIADQEKAFQEKYNEVTAVLTNGSSKSNGSAKMENSYEADEETEEKNIKEEHSDADPITLSPTIKITPVESNRIFIKQGSMDYYADSRSEGDSGSDNDTKKRSSSTAVSSEARFLGFGKENRAKGKSHSIAHPGQHKVHFVLDVNDCDDDEDETLADVNKGMKKQNRKLKALVESIKQFNRQLI